MTTQQTQTPQQRVAEAEQAMADARARAVYHGWSSVSANNAYDAAKRELRAAKGRGAAAYAILTGVVVAAIIAVLLLINAAHGGAF